MIRGFEDITSELSEYELGLVPSFVKGFSKRIGKENAITSREILKKMQSESLSGARIRKIVNYIRNGDYFGDYILKATSDGYYLTNDPKEISDYVTSLEGRENAIKQIRLRMLDKLKHDNRIQF